VGKDAEKHRDVLVSVLASVHRIMTRCTGATSAEMHAIGEQVGQYWDVFGKSFCLVRYCSMVMYNRRMKNAT
jgi:hypothetical protein